MPLSKQRNLPNPQAVYRLAEEAAATLPIHELGDSGLDSETAYELITSELLRAWSERFASSSAKMLVPRGNGYAHVLCAGYSHLLLPLIDARIAGRQYDLRSMAADAELVDHDGVELMNVNDPEELERYERQRLLTSR